jgi:ParB family chromosome partitioning protein
LSPSKPAFATWAGFQRGASLRETQTKEKTMTTQIQSIPLSSLVPSPANVRHTDKEARIGELAASIAAHGLLQNLTVRPVQTRKGKKTEDRFEVIGGGRRLAALNLLASQQKMDADALIPCNVRADGIAEELSLAENTAEPMHPADQFEAFSRLAGEHGMCAEDIAARFGVTAAIVRQRLALGVVSPALMAIYRAGDMNLEQLSAFTITGDHNTQERVWKTLGRYNRDRRDILRMLGEDKVSCNDRRARFVGIDAYTASGGTMLRDLFDEAEGGFLVDVDLLNRLAQEKLASETTTIAAEGWKWVSAMLEYDYSTSADMKRVFPEDRELTAEEEAKVEELERQYDEIAESSDYDDDDDGQSTALRRIDAEIEAIAGAPTFRADDISRAGTFITLGYDGNLRIERGYIRPEDMPQDENQVHDETEGVTTKPPRDPSALPERLVAELTGHRTAAIRNELAKRTDIAFAALLHALAADLFYSLGHRHSCLDLSLRSVAVEAYAPGITDNKALQEIGARHEAWQRRMPQEPSLLWDFITGLDRGELLELLAHCVSLLVDAIRLPGQRDAHPSLAHADILADALALDMTQYWTPTRDNYLKARCIF